MIPQNELDESKIFYEEIIRTPNKLGDLTALTGEFATLLNGGKNLLISTHVSPDADAAASLVAAAEITKTLGCNPICVLTAELPERYRFLPGSEDVREVKDTRNQSFDLALIVDCGSYQRIGDVSTCIADNALKINIDHHADNTQFGKLNIIHPEAASTTEILFNITRILNIPFTERLATQLYTGLLSDTGSFRYSNTTESALSIAAQLVKLGAKPHLIAENLYANNPLTSIRLLGQALASLELTANGQIATMAVSQTTEQEELEDFADFALSIQGVQASALLRLKNGILRVSMRGRGFVDVSRIAREFGGGGHPKAAGFTGKGTLDEVKSHVIEALSKEVEKSGVHPINQK